MSIAENKKECNQERKQENEVKKPPFLLYTVPIFLVRAFAKLYWKLRIDNKEIKNLKEPALAIAPHMSTLDVVPTMCTLFPHKYNIVAAKDLFTWKQLKPFIEKFGAIPMTQCAMDLNSLRTIKAASDNGRSILLYPEGRTSLDGRQLYYLNPSIGKLIKFLGLPVVLVKTYGAYVTKPRYIKGFRRGRMESKASILLTKEQVKALSPTEIYKIVADSFVINDNAWQQENDIKFKAKCLASNLNYILYKCPRCGAEYENTISGDTLKCNACGNTVKYTPNGHLVPIGDGISIDRIDLWMDYEKESVIEETEREGFCLSKEVTALCRNDETREYENVGEGELFINKEIIGYRGVINGAFAEMELPLKNMPTVITKNTEAIELTFDNLTYRFMFKEKKYSTKYGLIVEALYAKNHNIPFTEKSLI